MKRGNPGQTGLSPVEKETKLSSNISEMSEMSVENLPGVVVDGVNRTRRESESSMAPAVSRLSRRSINLRELDRALSFEPEVSEYVSRVHGAMKDRITVDILTLGEQPFKGTIKIKEAQILIYKKCLQLTTDNLHAIEIEWKGHPVITFRLIEPVNVDEHFTEDVFSYDRMTMDKNSRK